MLFSSMLIFVTLFLVLNFSTEFEQIVENENFNETVIEPEEEVSEDINFDTKVRLYFVDETSGILSYEDRVVDARELIDNPYMFVVNLLINGPEKPGLKNAIPDGTKLNKANIENGTVRVDFSDEFLNGSGTDAIYMIVDTLYEFNEVSSVKFTINGEEREGLKEKFLKKV